MMSVMEYTFTLKYRLADDDWDYPELAERLDASGCGDALVGIGKPMHISLKFTRDADSAERALAKARADVARALPNANLIDWM